MHPIAGDVLEGATEHVEADEGPEVADVPPRIHGEPAGVHPHGVVPEGGEGFFATRQRVEQPHHRGLSSGSAFVSVQYSTPSARPKATRRITRSMISRGDSDPVVVLSNCRMPGGSDVSDSSRR